RFGQHRRTRTEVEDSHQDLSWFGGKRPILTDLPIPLVHAAHRHPSLAVAAGYHCGQVCPRNAVP
ncbi:MAG TPA: hypothetical protein VIK97_05235, partial [Casimicrobiaceae bacterium]